ncbi:hypothetical protein AB0G74_30910 [Streptomyces sp. NPDC020875]|uniref:hypothetical protein n=1 Tax=Streptomyces sp. NPDC020875 TaxID=3154898 RepID=UPI0033D1FEC2
MLTSARSYRRNQISRAKAAAAIGRFRDGYKIRRLTEALDEFEDHIGDLRLVEGDLRISGDLDLTRERVGLLMVLGDLVVDGAYADSDDPESFLLVTGDMRARDVVTAGWLEVHGDLSTGCLIGDYNDCSASIGGDVSARLFYGEEHHFTIGGALGADAVIGRPRLEIAVPPAVIELDDPRMLDHFDRDLLRVDEDHHIDDDGTDGRAVTWIDGFHDFRELKRRVRAGRPLRTTGVRE